jgi:hypothetical protein
MCLVCDDSFGVVDSSCWIVNIHCRWFRFSSEEPMLTEISTVTGANNLIVLGLRRWFGVVDSSCWIVNIHCRWFQFSSEELVLTEISTVTGANNLISALQIHKRITLIFSIGVLSC